MSFLLVAQRALTVPGWVKNALWRAAKATPSLDLPFADSKSLVDAITGRQLISYARAGSGTYTDSAGVLSTAVTNLLLRSEEFNDASWSKTRSSVTANAIAAPDGSLTADKITEDTTPASTHVIAQTGTLISIVGARYTYSVYAKADGRDWLIVSPGGVWGYAWFNVSTGALGTVVDGGGATTASITSVGDGWYRCVVSATAVDTRGLQLLLSNANNVVSYTGNGTSGIYLWGAQLEQSSTVGEYIPTGSTINSAPRFDHNPLTGESLGLLVEEQRTNLLLRSEEFDNASWAKVGATVTANTGAAPDGATTADVFTRTTTGVSYATQTFTKTASAIQYTFSVFVKQSVGNFCALRVQGTYPSRVDVVFNLSSATISTAATVFGSFTGPSASITPYANGWYRLTVTATSDAVVALQVLASFNSNGIVLDGTDSVFTSAGLLWGAQLEVGATASSYIPTTTAAATRNADVAQITGTNFSSWYRQDEGTVFAEYIIPALIADGTVTSFDDGTANNRWQQRFTTAGQRYRLQSGGVSLVDDIGAGVPLVNATNKVAHTIRSDDQRYAANGALNANILTASPLPTVTQLQLGAGAAAGSAGRIIIRRLTYWPQRLDNATLQSLSRP